MIEFKYVKRETNAPVWDRDARVTPRLCLLVVWFTLIALVLTACGHSGKGQAGDAITFEAANALFTQGDYAASIDRYAALIEKAPKRIDRALFEMGIVYAHPRNKDQNYQKALECFQKVIDAHPNSGYRRDSQMMVHRIQHVIIKDTLIAEQQKQIDTYRQTINARDDAIAALAQKIESLEQKVLALRLKTVDKLLIEKKARRLTLLSEGVAVKTYTIALGGDPVGPKERQGDNKTPEGIYTIESKNRNSNYHLALRLSYPNAQDKKRAQALGVHPGGDIMIHGIKNGLSWIGRFHTGVDWTQGCIAVTDAEIEEIARLTPIGTLVEILP